MVTFYCEYCAATMKKKQVANHSCYPFKLFCVDCKITLNGMDYQQHNQCISEAQMVMGPYYKPKGQAHNALQERKQQQEKLKKEQEQEEELRKQKEEEQPVVQWKGWKRTIKTLLKQNKGKPMKTKRIKKHLVSLVISQGILKDKQEAEEIFDHKIKNRKFLNDGKFTTLQP